jgi:hypothetical protein
MHNVFSVIAEYEEGTGRKHRWNEGYSSQNFHTRDLSAEITVSCTSVRPAAGIPAWYITLLHLPGIDWS